MSRLNAIRADNLNSILHRGASPCPDPPPCPACGGLSCFCRPRFFAGQVLTEADLNHLETYVVDKNRLHNRYLHGWGVVCGLKVALHPCHDRVTVSSGYALGPCGDDIVVPDDVTAPICELIRKCRSEGSNRNDCPSPIERLHEDGLAQEKESTEEWVLAICYQETSSRGVMPLRSGSSNSSRCSCGGSSSSGCNCGCGGSRTSNSSARKSNCGTANRTAAAACEPTLTCEGYTFTVYRAPVVRLRRETELGTDTLGAAKTPIVGGQLSDKIRQSLQAMLQEIPTAPTSDASMAEKQQWFTSVKQSLNDLLATVPLQDATLVNRLASVTFPNPKSENFESEFATSLGGLALVLGELARERICDAMTPPCPPPADCNCVPLATLKVRRRDCRVLEVCNWQARKLVVTFPDLAYWLEGTAVFQRIYELIAFVCCRPPDSTKRLHLAKSTNSQNAATSTATTKPAEASRVSGVGSSASPLAQLLSQSWINRKDDRAIDALTLAGAYLGLADENGNTLASTTEMANPGAFLAVNQMLRPLLEGIVPTELSQLMSDLAIQRLQPPSTNVSAASAPDDLTALRQAVAELQATVKTQADQIATLQKK